MQFQVGPWRYRVRVSDDPLVDDVGLPAISLCSWRERVIWLCPNLPPEQRLDALFFELSRAWENHVGWPEGDEGRASWVASFTIDAWNQFERQGGTAALIRLGTDGVVDWTAPDDADAPAAEAYAIECPSCAGKIALGDVRTQRPRFDGKLGRLVIDRSAPCEHCSLLIRWTETATTMGTPAGRIVGEPATAPLIAPGPA